MKHIKYIYTRELRIILKTSPLEDAKEPTHYSENWYIKPLSFLTFLTKYLRATKWLIRKISLYGKIPHIKVQQNQNITIFFGTSKKMWIYNAYENTVILKRQPNFMCLLLEVHYTACEVF